MNDGFWYLLICRKCAEDSSPLIMPFESADARKDWARGHQTLPGHNSFLLAEEKRDPS